jgi:UDP-N-acetylmuramyl pentapeptide synthase
LDEQDSVLVKGSRSARLDELVAALRQAEAAC